MYTGAIADRLIGIAASDKRYSVDKLVNLYSYGSRVYGTWDRESDSDYIAVYNTKSTKEEFSCDSLHIIAYNINEFKRLIKEHDMAALECIFLQGDAIIKMEFPFKLSLPMLRHSVSAQASHSFVKAKKKLTVEKDYNERVGKKSLFHSLRIVVFGTQIAEHGRIINYAAANNYWADIILDSADWEHLKAKYKPIHNSLMTEFRKLAPKE